LIQQEQYQTTKTYFYDHTFNSKGQVTETIFRGDGCVSIKNYAYYGNGLIKSKSLDYCAFGWKVKYEYYKD
jgi:putative aminopeptidase FrvX